MSVIMKVERALFEQVDADAVAAADARARADIEAGRVIDHDKIVTWLKTWGTSDESPAPPEWLK